MRAIPKLAADFVRQHEGLKTVVSADVGGHLDGGYGHDDPTLKVGQKVTQRQADLWLKADLATAAQRLAKVVHEPVILGLTEHQYAALLSFVFNVGAQPGWQIWKVLNARDYDHVPAQLMRFVNAGGNKVQGLVNRRSAEVVLWSTEEPGSVPDQPSSAVTRAIATPPTPADVKPLHASTSFVTSCCTAAVAVGAPLVEQAKGAVKAVNDNIAPYVGASNILQHLNGALSVGLAVLGVTTVFLMWLKNQKAKSQ